MTQVKICGLTNLADAQAAVEAGADLLGFIFYPRSPRYVAPEQVQGIVSALAGARQAAGPRPRLVGVFVNRTSAEIRQVLDTCGLDLAQLHGEERVEDLRALEGQGYKALRPPSLAAAQAGATAFGGFGAPQGPDLLLDAFHPDLRGGTGEIASWSVAAQLAGHYRLLLAGGLTATNVARAVSEVRPWGVDVASGIEAEPGRKDHDLLRAFIAAAKGLAPP